MKKVLTRLGAPAFAMAALSIGLGGCGSGSSSSDNTVTVAGDVPIAYAKRAHRPRR